MSVEALKQAKAWIPRWQKMANSSNLDRAELTSELQEIINMLETIKYGTTAYKEGQELLKSAREMQQKL